MRFLLAFLAIGLTVYSVIDCLRTPEQEMKHLPKPVWLIVVIVVAIVGPIIWLLTGRDRGHLARPATLGGAPKPPDDDPEFLARLEQQRRLRAWEEELRQREERLRRDGQDGGTTTDDDTPPPDLPGR